MSMIGLVQSRCHEGSTVGNFGNLDKEGFLIIYKGFIRSHMVYAIRILRRTLIIWKRFREGQRN